MIPTEKCVNNLKDIIPYASNYKQMIIQITVLYNYTLVYYKQTTCFGSYRPSSGFHTKKFKIKVQLQTYIHAYFCEIHINVLLKSVHCKINTNKLTHVEKSFIYNPVT